MCQPGSSCPYADRNSQTVPLRRASARDLGFPIPMVSTIHTRLRAATRAVHLELERHLAMSPEVSLVRYTRIIALFYGFYRPIEAGLNRLDSRVPSRTFPLRARSALLKRDLVSLGLAEPAISGLPTCSDLPGLREPEHFAGCLYVLEGASLGGQIIARSLRERLQLTDRGGTAFFAGDGAATVARGQCVLQWLEHVSQSGLHAEQIVTSASETFGSLLNWAHAQGLNHEH